MDTIGLIISFLGTVLMIPESIRLIRKNPEGGIRWKSDIPGANKCIPILFVVGIIFLALGFSLQLTAICIQ